MYETIKNNKKKVTIFALGPLTNLARLYQEIILSLKILMK